MSKHIPATEVRNFFKEASLDLAELSLELGTEIVSARRASAKAVSDRMAKARAGRKGGKRHKAQVTSSASASASETPAQPAQAGRAVRHPGEPASHAAESAIAG